MNAFHYKGQPSVARTDGQLRRSGLRLTAGRRNTRRLITTTVKAGQYTLAPIGRLDTLPMGKV